MTCDGRHPKTDVRHSLSASRDLTHQAHVMCLTLLHQSMPLHATCALLTQAAKALWDYWYETLETGCIHGPNCRWRKEGGFW